MVWSLIKHRDIVYTFKNYMCSKWEYTFPLYKVLPTAWCGAMGKDIATKFKLILLWFSVRCKLLQLQC